jgi:type I restriction enzyme S subunit
MIRSTNFEQNDFNNLKYLNKHSFEFLKKTKVYSNDILMNKIANPGKAYLMPEMNKPVSLGMNLFLIRINNKSSPVFLFYYLRYK